MWKIGGHFANGGATTTEEASPLINTSLNPLGLSSLYGALSPTSLPTQSSLLSHNATQGAMVTLAEPLVALQQLMLNESLLSKASLTQILALAIDDDLKLAVELLYAMHEVEEKIQVPISDKYSQSYILVPKLFVAAILIFAMVLGAMFSGGDVIDGIVAGFYCFGTGSLLAMLAAHCAAKKIQDETITTYTKISDANQLILEHQQQFELIAATTDIVINHAPIAEILSNWIKEKVHPFIAPVETSVAILMPLHEEIDESSLDKQGIEVLNTNSALSL